MLVSGIDLVEIARIERAVGRWGERFLRRVWTEAERRHCGRNMASLAARWAAKEAAAKALGSGLRGLGAVSEGVAWTEIEIERAGGGQPRLALHGAAARRALELGISEWTVSLSHSGGLAVAAVVGLARGGADGGD